MVYLFSKNNASKAAAEEAWLETCVEFFAQGIMRNE